MSSTAENPVSASQHVTPPDCPVTEVSPTTANQPPNSAGRPPVFTNAKQSQFCDLLRIGCSRAEAARAIGVSLRTIARRQRDDPQFAEAVDQAFSASDNRAYRSVARAGEQSWRAAAWLLEHRARQERRPLRPSPDMFLKSPRFAELLRDVVCEAIVANEISVDPGVLRRRERLTEVRYEIESRQRRGEDADHLQSIAHDLVREIAKSIRLAMRPR